MANIQVLDQITIDKIAAGEVVERPASIVKELVENAIDAKATAVTVEIEDGGITYIRVTDNGCGIPKNEIPLAFLRHSTSKIRSVTDLETVSSLGFRGEALSSIAAIAQVEVLTKTKDAVFGTRYCIEGGVEKSIEDMGAVDGTTFMIRQIFYNTPARRKFLKTPMTEASHISDLMLRLALSHPEVSIRFINNGQTRIHSSGNGKLKDVIYHVYGREISGQLLEVQSKEEGIRVHGFIGKPVVSRGNRNYENYYVNGRYVKSNIIAKAIEDAYKDFTMQHKYPFTVLHFEMTGSDLDVNVHPTKMELRFSNQQVVYDTIYRALKDTLSERELIPSIELSKPEIPKPPQPARQEEKNMDYFMRRMKERVTAYHNQASQAEVKDVSGIHRGNDKTQADRIQEAVNYRKSQQEPLSQAEPTQQNLFDDLRMQEKNKPIYTLIGQVFDTYWLVEYKEQLYIIDQHAAHERVLYEKTLRGMKERVYTSQYVSPPVILNLSMQEEETLKTYFDTFANIGFEIEPFGTGTYAIRAVPDNLFGIAQEKLFIELLDSLADGINTNLAPDIVSEKVASMSCKAAVKGNSKLSAREVDALICELLTLDNPYHCPHGRPTIIAMSKRELEKKFKRII